MFFEFFLNFLNFFKFLCFLVYFTAPKSYLFFFFSIILVTQTHNSQVVRLIKEDCCYVAFNPAREEQMEAEHHTEVKDYKLPDGRVIKVGAERFRASEILFNPSIVGFIILECFSSY
mgnify:CR=1 FL=1